MAIFGKKKEIETQNNNQELNMKRYSVPVLEADWTSVCDLLRKSYNIHEMSLRDGTVQIDGADAPVVYIAFQTTEENFIEFRVALGLKQIGVVKTDSDEGGEKK